MTDDDASGIGALRLEQRQLRQPDRRHDGVGRDRETRASRCLPGGPVDALLEGRYVALNPVRAGLCQNPAQWPWSSYRALAGLDAAPEFLCESFILSLFGDTIETARARFRHFVNDELDTDRCLTRG